MPFGYIEAEDALVLSGTGFLERSNLAEKYKKNSTKEKRRSVHIRERSKNPTVCLLVWDVSYVLKENSSSLH